MNNTFSCFYKQNPLAGQNNGGYAKKDEIIDTLYINKNGQIIELTGAESMVIYNMIKPVTAPTWTE